MIPKFRAWDKKHDEMLEVRGISFDTQHIWAKEMLDDEYDVNFIFLSDVELLQSTGLEDKNGTEIYEGDVVKYDPVPNLFFANSNFEVTRARTGEWRIDNHRGGSGLAFCNYKVEIIGNKYEHPHLLEE
ncbi:YopX family protein [Staphylococcus xylosus]|uniref:YopX family protein n=1 Tax=Staphylococcus xylosus TaxID=1288 RepID=UPI00217527D8|nr:YopX family protein [Staphylococcus xylosus]